MDRVVLWLSKGLKGHDNACQRKRKVTVPEQSFLGAKGQGIVYCDAQIEHERRNAGGKKDHRECGAQEWSPLDGLTLEWPEALQEQDHIGNQQDDSLGVRQDNQEAAAPGEPVARVV